ncbi:MAG: hydrogenase iron-sulfur subunit [Candidatus Dormibacteraeota bacterium]|jgi:coenzyme F420-reducing hydrogenase delta subunit|nr:hydrogenase iron-sulfur subunit [Candidatus Dormibacteraeota bacterium]
MAVTMAPPASTPGTSFGPKILVFSTNNISDPGIDLAGSSHLHYSPRAMTLAVPCSSGIAPEWIAYAFDQGMDGVFIASDGEECSYLSDCSERSARVFERAQEIMAERGYAPERLKMAAICSVCAEPFVKYMREFEAQLRELGPARVA